ncbi:hypothetical protein R3W88_000150 [Solanum pinnatisectum]|uniref:Uncharacterized protein n=1 Tax=Solanum pinnatisectum TaxID=50273 RepID=A0AAV9MGD0_9SOLN|nr:hypothetical protein R3W88_000150 [Solanum pinnatisectum]
MTNTKIYKGDITKSTSKDEEEEGQLELYSPKYALKVNNNTYQKKPNEEGGQMELYSPKYALKVKDDEVNEKMKQKQEVEEKEKKNDVASNCGPLAKPLSARLTSRI